MAHVRPSSCCQALGVALAMAGAVAQGTPFTETVTQKGVRIWSFGDDDRDRFVLAVLVGVGSRDETGHAGIAHFLQHVVLARTPRRPRAAIDSDLSALGIEYAGLTTHESTIYWLQCGPRDWQFAVDWLADHVLRPAFDAEDIAAERQAVRAELETAHPHAGQVTFEEQLYPGHPLGRAVGGEPMALEAIDRRALAQFHALHYRAGNVAVGFAGRVPREACMEAIRAAFEPLPPGKGAEVDLPVRPRTGDLSPRSTRPGVAAAMTTGFHLPAQRPRDLAMAGLLGAYLRQRFFHEVREVRQLAYAPEVNTTLHRDTCRLDFHVEVAEPADLRAVVQIIDALVGELQRVDIGRFEAAGDAIAGLLEGRSGPQLAEAMQFAWLLRRQGMSPGEFGVTTAVISEAQIAEYARTRLTNAYRFTLATVAIAAPFSAWAALAVLAVLLLLLDGFQGFSRSARLCRVLTHPVRVLVRRPRPPAKATVPPGPPSPPIVPVPGDEIAKSIQRYFEDEERGR